MTNAQLRRQRDLTVGNNRQHSPTVE